jgi:hypothetical protein
VLGYYSKDTRRDGRFRRVEVKVNRPGLAVRARKGYVAAKGRPASEKPFNEKASPELRAAIESPVPISALGITAFAAALKGSGSNASLAIALEIDGRRLRFVERGGVFEDDVEVVILAVDDSGKPREGGRDLLNLRLRPQTHALVARNGVRIMRRLEVPPGRYQLRIGVRDTGSGAVGSVLYDLDVPDFNRTPLGMSNVLLTSASASYIPTANADPELKDVLPAAPAAHREFPPSDTLSAFAEIYDNQTRTPHRIAIKASVLSDTGAVLFTTESERSSDELKGGRGGYGHTATIPLKDFAPGRYVLRFEARTLLKNGPTVSRDVEFRVR